MTGRSPVFGPLIVFAVFGAVACIYWPTVSFLLIWRDNDPGTHAWLVVVVVWFLIWNLREELAVLPIHPLWLGFVGLIGLGFVWLSGRLVFTLVFTQFAVIAMVPMAVLTLLGVRWLTTLVFPFFVLVFALPIFNPLIPILVKWTAKFVEFGIHASGVPIYREGAYFVLPSGSWSIADACSGAAFLSTCLLLGVLYAWTIYQSSKKRLIFVIGSAAIGVVGNWIRVYLTMMVAHITDNRMLRDKHETFGWLLFAVFLSVFCWLGWRHRDATPLKSAVSQRDRAGVPANASFFDRAGGFQFIAISAAILVTMGVWPLLEARFSLPQAASEIQIADISVKSGWSRAEKASVAWVPELNNPSRVRVQTFEKGGRRVNVFIGVFQNESWRSKLVSDSNRLAGDVRTSWSLAERGVAFTDITGIPFEAKTGIVLVGQDRVLTWHWYWIDGLSTSNGLRAKIQQLYARLQGVPATSAWVAIYTVSNASSEDSPKLLQEFMREMGGSLQSALVRTAEK